MRIDIGELKGLRVRAGATQFGSTKKRATGETIHYRKVLSMTLIMDFEKASGLYLNLDRRQARQLEQSLRKLLLIPEQSYPRKRGAKP